jgi:hypothetical protein
LEGELIATLLQAAEGFGGGGWLIEVKFSKNLTGSNASNDD